MQSKCHCPLNIFHTDVLSKPPTPYGRRTGRKINEWRSIYPIHGTRSYLAGPPGWRAPLDWSTYPMPLDKLQAAPARSMAPTDMIEKILDFQHGEHGRLTYIGKGLQARK